MSLSAEQQEKDHTGSSTEFPRETRDPIEDVWVGVLLRKVAKRY